MACRGRHAHQAAAGLALLTLLACALPAVSGVAATPAFPYSSFDDVPGVTQNATAPLAFLHPPGVNLVVFGDSVSSTRETTLVVRQALNLSGPVVEPYPPPPYFQGRWSNGPVYTEYLAQLLGLRLVDLAVGGAGAGTGNNSILNVAGSFPAGRPCPSLGTPPACPAQVILVPSLWEQVNEYIQQQSQGIPHQDIILLEIGANDVFCGLFGPGKAEQDDYGGFADRVVDAIINSLQVLHKAGARRFLVFNVPPVSRTPLIIHLAAQDASLLNHTSALVDAINTRLAPRINAFKASSAGAAVVFYTNILLDMQTQQAAPALGFTNQRNPCSTFPIDLCGSPAFAPPPDGSVPPSVCQQPNDYIFWDHVHFTTRFHWLQAGVVAAYATPLLAL